MATVTGAQKSWSNYNSTKGSQRAQLVYTTSQTDTTFTVTVSSATCVGSASVLSGALSRSLDAPISVSATGQTGDSHTFSVFVSSSGTTSFNEGYTTNISGRPPFTFTWDRGTSAATKTISLSTTIAGTTSTVSVNVTVPALQSWSVTYDANSGTGAPSQQTKYYGVNLTLSSIKPSKDGYKFNGWATSEANAKAGTVAYASGGTYSGNAALTLWAVWELAYTKPIINNLKVDRCKSDGTLDDEGTYALVSFDWAVYNTASARYYGGNTYPYSNNGVSNCTITITDGTITKTATPTLSGSSGSASIKVGDDSTDGPFDTDAQYSVTLSVTDSQAVYNDKTTTVSGVLATSFFPIDINSDASALAFLMPAPDNVSGVYFGADIKLSLPDYQTADTTDKALYDAIVALGWQDVLES